MKNDNIKGWMENCMRDFIFKTEYKKLLTPEVVSCLTPVSYTHLDVYKRQAMGCNSLCIKDMAGIMSPQECYDLVLSLIHI